MDGGVPRAAASNFLALLFERNCLALQHLAQLGSSALHKKKKKDSDP